MPLLRIPLIFIALLMCLAAYSQDIDFHITGHFLQGKTFIKIKQDFYDPYVWALTDHNGVFRINGITKAVDDLTEDFAAFGNLKFMDIAGRSKDTVFISTASSVIQYKNGAVKLLTTDSQFPSTINSIGIQKSESLIFTRNLLIGSDKGLFQYDMDAEKPAQIYYEGAAKIFEATYRNEMYKDSLSEHGPGDTVTFHPVTFVLESVHALGFLWTGGQSFGNNIYTATCIPASLYQFGQLITYSSAVWGTEKGLFELNADASFNSNFQHRHYLPGIKVNKVTTMYGLVALGNAYIGGDATIIKNNLLAGTDKGLYYTSNFYEKGADGMHALNFFFFNQLGTLSINDLCVNTSATTRPICDNGVWLATVDGVYLLTPDYSKYIGNTKVAAVYFKGLSQNISETSICTGSSVTATVNTQKYSTAIIEWYQDNQQIPGQSGPELQITKSGDYHAVLHDPCSGIHIESEPVKVTVTPGPVFSFHYPDKIEFCDRQSARLETANNDLYNYRWYRNGELIDGENSSSINLMEGGDYKVEVSACDGSWVGSKSTNVTIDNLPEPQITTSKTNYCEGEPITLTSNLKLGPEYIIDWIRNGVIMNNNKNQLSINTALEGLYAVIVTSVNSACSKVSGNFRVTIVSTPVFTFNYPDVIKKCPGETQSLEVLAAGNYKYRWYKNNELNGEQGSTLNVTASGKYRVELSACDESWVTSKDVQVDFVELPQPRVSSDKPSYCAGDTAILKLNMIAHDSYTINWYKGDQLLSDYRNKTNIIITEGGAYSVKIEGTDAACAKISNQLIIAFDPQPLFNIQRIVNSTLCDGQDVELKVSNNAGDVKWSTGESSEQILVRSSGIYSATITTPGGCATNQQMPINFYPLPRLNLSNVSLCTYKRESAIITAPPGFVKYLWNNTPGTNTFIVTEPQTISLTVTDTNGCQASQEIKVINTCMQIKIPNTFTPNGDGINDNWNIEGLENDGDAEVRVFSRYGTKVYESHGYPKPWDATFLGKKLPAGVYYYLIGTKLSVQRFSGSLSIIY